MFTLDRLTGLLKRAGVNPHTGERNTLQDIIDEDKRTNWPRIQKEMDARQAEIDPMDYLPVQEYGKEEIEV